MSQDDLKNQYKNTKAKIDKVSPAFCLAKWYQVTLHLQNGHNHSCHHPNTHQTTPEELDRDPSSLHNTAFKKQIRQMMLEGVRPKECEYCWKIEDTPGEHYSDRTIKSNDEWARPFFQDALAAGSTANVNPKYLEVSFSNSCNFKCAYCLPHISSSWMKELKQFGEYKTQSKHHAYQYLEKTGKMPIMDTSKNPYVHAFWEWWPSLYHDLKTLRITGGEPFMVPDTYRVLDYVIQNPNKELSLAINSNLGVEKHLIDKAVEKISKATGNIKDITIFTSLDTWGPQSEYIRYGLDLQLFKENLETVLEKLPAVNITFMCTYNLLSIAKFREFLEFILELKNKYKKANSQYDSRIVLDISYLKDPHFMSANIASPDLMDRMKSDLNFMTANSPDQNSGAIGFTDFELNKMLRLYNWASRGCTHEFQKEQLKDLYIFFAEYDKRRNTDFIATFPEYKNLWLAGLTLAAETAGGK